MFRGGVTKADVERMREKAKTAGKKKGIPRKDKAPAVCMEGDSRITSIVNAILRPEVNRIDGNIADVVSSVKEVSAQSVEYENKVIAIVEGMLQSFMTEMMKFMPTLHTQSAFAHPNSTAAGEEPGVEGVPSKTTPIPLDDNDEIIENVIENLSHYSTPPAAENECPYLRIQNSIMYFYRSICPSVTNPGSLRCMFSLNLSTSIYLTCIRMEKGESPWKINHRGLVIARRNNRLIQLYDHIHSSLISFNYYFVSMLFFDGCYYVLYIVFDCRFRHSHLA
ncbi:unnamed protein product [Brassica rapa]|uniref:Uncharacterized protein n=1 Tax=Brassica campestris TaxID=3711 RepID=A0A3P6B7A3_BRACM|nr:unnamed protein product [Brassica rapa]VDC96949.1 unnamed protein product [Brassica rapa]